MNNHTFTQWQDTQWSKMCIITLIIIVFLVSGCQPSSPSVTAIPMTPRPVTPPIPTEDIPDYLDFSAFAIIPEDAILKMLWVTEFGINLYVVTENGDFFLLRTGGRGKDKQLGVLSPESLESIKNSMSQLQHQTVPQEINGDQLIVVQTTNDNNTSSPIICGNRHCPPAIHEIAWEGLSSTYLMGAASPFDDESYIQIEANSSHILWLSWFESLDIYPYRLILDQDYKVVTFCCGQTETWYVDSSELGSVQECFSSLVNSQETANGDDLMVIKAYVPSVSDSLIRLDKQHPPKCLQSIIATLQSSLKQEKPQSNLQISLFE